MFYGQGAGGAPTASAVMGDLVMAARNKCTAAAGPRESKYAKLPIAPIGVIPTRYYVNMNVEDRPGVLSAVAAEFGKHEVSIAAVRQEGMVDEGGRGAAPASSWSPTWRPTPRCRKPLRRWPNSTSCSASTACCDWKAPTNEHHSARAVHQPWPGLIEAYRDRLAIGTTGRRSPCCEGGTPLIPRRSCPNSPAARCT